MKQDKKPERETKPSDTASSRARRPRYVWLNVLPDGLWLRVRKGETVWKALQKTNVELEGDCGGLGTCGKCKVKVLSLIGPPSEEEQELLDEEELKQGIRLACRVVLDHDLVVSTIEAASKVEYFQILTTSHILSTPHLSRMRINPLIEKLTITIPPELQDEGISALDRVRLAMGTKYQDMKAPLECLRTLPEMLEETQFHGVAVLHDNCLMAWRSWEKKQCHYGLIFDLGTSTLVGKLINLVDGTEAGVISCLNSQSKHGTNVISRLQYIKERRKGLQHLHRLLLRDLNWITARLLETPGLNPSDIFVAVAAGNTTMQHLLLSLDPSGIAEAPFSPVLTDGLIVKAADVGLELHPEALLYVMPAKSGYIGGDLISVILASGAWEQKDAIILGLDLGTNGEIFLGNSKRLMTCSAAAGPAFEGAGISHGMIAKAGAIEAVNFEAGRLHYRVIGNIAPKGICGSGLVGLVAVLLQLGIIDYEGSIRPPQGKSAAGLRSAVLSRSGVYGFLIASAEESYHHKPIYLTQKDVRELQLVKGAIAAGIRILMDEMGIGTKDIGRVFLSGAFGNYIDPYRAAYIGLIPGLDPEIVTSLGNAASTGASMVLVSKDYWQRANELAHSIEHIELSHRHDFNQYFIEHMDFPEQNMW
jgi:uncharacterized 2Fe-2S/4Fe-4S cluster protein (DUF4445 family)